jgi:cell division protein FtsI (penicillin-binding protein 3)
VVRQILDQKGNPVKQFSPQCVRQVISPETARLMRSLLIRVTEPGGTATQAAIEGLSVGGKTGTAQKVSHETKHYAAGRYMSNFMGFLPAEDPSLIIVVVVDEPKGSHYGGVVAAPIFKAIAEQSLAIQGIRRLAPVVPSEQPYEPLYEKPDMAPLIMAQQAGEEEKTSPTDLQTKRIMPDIRGMSMRKVLEVMKGYETPVVFLGSGKAVTQSPLPGTVLNQKTRCQVQFQPVL